MTIRLVFSAALATLTTVMSGAASADTIFTNAGTGTDIRTAGNWDNGLPTAADDGFLSIDATIGGNFNANGSTNFVNSTLTQDAGTLTGTLNANAAGFVYNLTGGTLNSASGNLNANAGSIFNFSGGEAIFGNDLIVNSSSGGINVSGDAIISTGNDFDLRLNADNAFFDIAADWTGALVSGNDATEADWIAELVFGAGPAGSGGTEVDTLRQVNVGTTGIDESNFSDFFVVTADGTGGSSLTLVAVPEPSSLTVLAFGIVGMVARRRRS